MPHIAPGDLGAAVDGATERPGRPRRVAVLGGTGLIGSAVARAFLDAGSDVEVLARRPPGARVAPLLEGATLHLGDATDRDALHEVVAGTDHVVDALGVPPPAASAADAMGQLDTEIPLILAVLDEVRRARGIGLTYVSSGGAIYGDAPSLPVREETECHPRSPYGIAKLAAERFVLMAAREDAVAARILRVANAYGARQQARPGQGLVAAGLHAASSGDPVHVFGDGTAVRDYVEVRDVAAAVVALSASSEPTRVVNVGTGTGHRLADVLALIETVTNTTLRIVREPPRPTDVRDVVLDVARLEGLMDWQPMSLECGIRDAWATLTAWRDAGLPRGVVAT